MYEVRNIAFSYGSHRVLDDVSFVVSPGETVSVVGSNGAGKSTLLRVLSTLLLPDSGLVMLDGQDAFRHSLSYRRKFGFLSEGAPLADDMRVGEYLAYRAALKGELPKRIRRRVEEAVELCRIGEYRRMWIGRLSQGVRKRVALADALLLRPRVLLLDDFLAGLDRSMRMTAGAILSDVAAFASVIVTGHEFEDLAQWTTRFLVLDHGVIAAELPTSGADHAVLVEQIDRLLKGGAS